MCSRPPGACGDAMAAGYRYRDDATGRARSRCIGAPRGPSRAGGPAGIDRKRSPGAPGQDREWCAWMATGWGTGGGEEERIGSGARTNIGGCNFEHTILPRQQGSGALRRDEGRRTPGRGKDAVPPLSAGRRATRGCGSCNRAATCRPNRSSAGTGRLDDDAEHVRLREAVNRKPVEPLPTVAAVAVAAPPGRELRARGTLRGAHPHRVDDDVAETGMSLQTAARSRSIGVCGVSLWRQDHYGESKH